MPKRRTRSRQSAPGGPRARATAIARAIAALPRPLDDSIRPPKDPLLALACADVLAHLLARDALPRLLQDVERDPSLEHGYARIAAHVAALDRARAAHNAAAPLDAPDAFDALLTVLVALDDLAASVVVAAASAPSVYDRLREDGPRPPPAPPRKEPRR